MKKWYDNYKHHAKWILLFLLSSLFFVLLLKQIDLYKPIVKLVKAVIPLLFACIIAFLFEPLIQRIHLKRFMSSVIVYGGFLIILVLISLTILPSLISQGVKVFQSYPSWQTQIEGFLNNDFISLLSIQPEWIIQTGSQLLLVNAMKFMDACSTFFVSYLAAFFISIDLDFIKGWAIRCIPNYHKYALFYHTTNQVVFHYIRGICIDLLFLLLTITTTLWIFHYENALLYGVVLSLFHLIPYVGPTIGVLVLALGGLLQTGYLDIWPLLIIFVIQQIEGNWVQPYIFQKVMDLRPILTLGSLLIFGSLFGFVGILLSPIIAGIIQIGFRSYLYTKRKETVGSWEEIWYNFDDLEINEEDE